MKLTGAVSGRSASRDQITRVLYLVQRFNPVIEIGDVECYHIGYNPLIYEARGVLIWHSDDYIVEIDVILPAGCSMHFAHDIGETIQVMIEWSVPTMCPSTALRARSLDGVLRAYVQ